MIPVRSRSRSSLVLFLFGIQAIVVRTHLLRHKRHWVPPPVRLTENQDYTQKEFIAKIRSDRQTEGNVIYSLEGVGANQYPFHLFVVDPNNGNVRVTRKLDREEIPLYKLAGFAKFPNGTKAEEKIDLQIMVIDVNDNAPTFESSVLTAEVDELSPIGTSVITISATDKDDNTTNHAKIAYFIKNQKPRDYFNMNKNGTIYVNSVLDREKEKTVLLTVIGQDMFGAPGGHIATATVTINIRDVNDNPPTLENEAFEGDIEENTSGVEVMRIKAEDMDIDRDNWEAVFEIVQGDENGYFSIKTDPVTNEGILFLEKPVDFEDVKDMNLGLAVRNKAPLVDGSGSAGGANIGFGGGAGGSSGASGSGASGNGATGATGASGASGAGGASGASGATGAGGAWGSKIKTYPIKINVKNQPEGPHFEPKVRPIPIKEGTPIDVNKVIASYPAIDKDTGKPAEDVKYLKGSDPQNWLSIDPKTAEIKLNKMPDRESPFLVNGVYMAEILCITEGIPSKTATGTVAIQVEDLNDHCPELTRDFIPMCKSNKSIIVNAKDEDAFPNGPPFKFSILPGSTTVNWKMIPYNDTAVVLTTSDNVESVHSNLMLVVEDQQKLSCPKPQKLTVFFCDCTEKDGCSTKGAINWIKPKVSLGPAGIGLLFLGVLAVLIIPLLMIMTQCGSPSGYNDLFVKMPFDTKQHLINYETEGPGDLTESQIKNLPLPSQKSDVQMVQSPGFGMEQSFASMYQGGSSEYRDGVLGMSHWEKSGSHFESEGGQSRGGAATKYFKDMSLPDSYLKGYYNNKLSSGDEKIVQKDHMLVFDYEGTGSSAGSVGCCSNLQQDCDLEFLDNLGPSFKTLAEICGGKIIQTETTQVATPLPNPSANNSQVSVPKLVTSQEIVLPSKVQPAKSTTEQTLICKTSKTTEHAKVRESKATVREGVTSVQTGKAQNQMLVVNQQQPVYFTTAPMLQPIQYVVQQPLQNAMILAETPGHNLQHMVMVNGTDFGSSQGVFVQGQTMMPSAQPQSLGAVLVDSNGIQGTTGNMVHAGNFSGTQNMMVVEGQVPLGTVKVLNGNETSLIQGGTMLNDLLGCQTMLKIGESSSVGQQLQDGRGVFQTAEVTGLQKGHDLSAVESSRTSSNTLSTTHVIHKTAVQYE